MTFLGRFKTRDNPHSGMIQRCSERRVAATHDSGFSVSDEAAKVMGAAKFPPNHSASCDCGESGGKIKPSDCQHLHISDADGNKVARFDIKKFGAARASDRNIVIYHRPASQTKDSSRKLTLHDLNQIHEKFYERGPEPW